MNNEIFKLYARMEKTVLGDPDGEPMAKWAASLRKVKYPEVFIGEAQWIILCSGISWAAAKTMQKYFKETGKCRHPHKEKAILSWSENGRKWWKEYQRFNTDEGRIAYLRTLPYMGGKALVYQLAKNLGITEYCKPDVHLVRIAKALGYSQPQALCEDLSLTAGVTVAYIDTILWFAAMRKWIYLDPYYLTLSQ